MKKMGLLAGLAFIAVCNAADKITVKNVQDITSFGSNTFIYSLPRTKLRIDITAIRQYTIPGPYSQFAEKLLGMPGITSPSTEWDVENIDVMTIEEPDPENYFAIESNNNKKIISSKTLTSFEDKLQENHFCRIHRSVMINLNYIQNIKHDKQKGYVVVMNDNTELEIARRKRKEFLQLFS